MNEEELERYLAEVCPCCGMYPPSDRPNIMKNTEILPEINFGLAAMIHRFKVWIWIMGGTFLLSLYMVIRNILGKQCLSEEQASDPTILSTNQYLLKGFTVCLKNWITIHSLSNIGLEEDWFEAVLLILAFAFITAGIKYGIYFSHKFVQTYLDNHHQASDWALRVARIPGETEAEIRKKIELVGDGTDFKIEVVKVIIPSGLTNLIQLREKYRKITDTLEKKEKTRQSSIPETEIAKLETEKMRLAKAKTEEAVHIQAGTCSQDHFIMTAIVIFKTKEMAHRVYQHWNPDPPMTFIWQSAEDKGKVPKDFYAIQVWRCEQPEHINWVHHGSPLSVWPRVVGFITGTALLIVSAMALQAFKNHQNKTLLQADNIHNASMQNSLLSLGGAAIALMMYEFTAAVVVWIFSYCNYESKQQASDYSKAIRLPIFMFFCVIYFAASYRTTHPWPDVWGFGGPLHELWYLLLLQTLVQPVWSIFWLHYFQSRILKLYWRSRIRKNKPVNCDQKTFNAATDQPEFDYSKAEVEVANLCALACSLIPLIPLASLLAVAGIAISILTQRVHMYHFSRGSLTNHPTTERFPIGYLFIFTTIPYGFVLWYITARMIVLDIQTAFTAFAVMLGIPTIMLCFVSDLGVRGFLLKKNLLVPWSRKGEFEATYTEQEHTFEMGYETENYMTREEAFARVEWKIRGSNQLQPLQKKALLTRLGIQKNLIGHREKDRMSYDSPPPTDRQSNWGKDMGSTQQLRTSVNTNAQPSPSIFRKISVVRPTSPSKMAPQFDQKQNADVPVLNHDQNSVVPQFNQEENKDSWDVKVEEPFE